MKKIIDIIDNINKLNPEPISNATIKAILVSYNLRNLSLDLLNIGQDDLYKISFNCIKKSCKARLEKANTFGEDENIRQLYEKIINVDLSLSPKKELESSIDKIAYFKQNLTFIENEFICQLHNCIIRIDLTSDQLISIPETIFENIIFIALQIFAKVTAKYPEIFNSAVITSIGNLSSELEELKKQINNDFIASDINKLNHYNQSILDLISTELSHSNNVIELPRIKFFEDINKALENNNILGITGEPGVGKSALLKKLALGKEKFIAISDKKIFELAQGWSNFFKTNLDELLLYLNQEGYKYIFIDGLDKITNPDQQTIIQDLINTINRHSENSKWKIIFTSRSYDNSAINQSNLGWLSLRKIFYVPVEEISNEELNELIEKFPKLSSIFYQREISKVSKNLFLLKTLLSSDLYESLKENEKISEIDISQLWWTTAIGNGELGRFKQNLLRTVANKTINGLFYIPDENTNIYALNALLDDKILIENYCNEYSFREDIYEDWVIYQILYNNRVNIQGVIENSKQFGLYRPFKLLSNYLLESEQIEIWNGILKQLENLNINKFIQAFISAPLMSLKVIESLNKIENILIDKENNYKYLNILINKLKTECTYPDLNIIYSLSFLEKEDINNLSDELFSIFNLFEYKLPYELAWHSVISLLIKNVDELKSNFNFYALVELFDFYQRKAKYNYFRKQLGDMAYFWYLERKEVWHFEKECKEKLLTTFLYSVEENQDLVKSYIYTVARNDNTWREKEQLLKKNNYEILAKKIPKDYGNCLIGILLKKIKTKKIRDKESKEIVFSEIGFSDDFNETLGIETYATSVFSYPTNIAQGPFLYFLNQNKEEALRVIHSITKWAMNIYIYNKKLTPIPINIDYDSGNYSYIGNEFIYLWFRDFNQTPEPIAVALMALEKWCFKESINRPLRDIIKDIINNTSCITFIGIALSLIMYSIKEKKDEAIKELFEIVNTPQLLRLEEIRFEQDMANNYSIDVNKFLGIPENKLDKKLSKMLKDDEHRKYRLLNDIIVSLYIYGQLEEEYIVKLIESLNQNTIFLYDEEKNDPEFKSELDKKSQFYLSFLNKDNWKLYKYPDGQIIPQYEDESVESQEDIQKAKEANKFLLVGNINAWGHYVLSGEKKDFTDKYSPELVWQIVSELYENIEIPNELNFNSISVEENTQIGTIFWGISGLLYKHFDWIESSNLIEKIKGILIKYTNTKVVKDPLGLNFNNYNLKEYYPPIPSLFGLAFLFEKGHHDKELVNAVFDGFNNINLIPVINCYSNIINKLWDQKGDIAAYLLDLGIKIINNDENKENLIEEFKQKYFERAPLKLNSDIQITKVKQYINFTTLLYFIPIDKLNTSNREYFKNFIKNLLIYRINLKDSLDKIPYGQVDYDQNFADLLAILLKELNIEESKEFLSLFKDNYFKDPYFTSSIFEYLTHRLISYYEPLESENIEKWKYFAHLALEEIKATKFHQKKYTVIGEENLSSLIIFVSHNLRYITVFLKKDWPHINSFIDIIDEWVKTLGINPYFYFYFSKCISHFIDKIDYQKILEWLDFIIENNINKEKFLNSDNNIETMFILNSLWAKDKYNILKNKHMFEIFSKLIHLYSELGVESANNIFYEIERL